MLDISHNKIDLKTDKEVEELIDIFRSMKTLGVLYLMGNPVVKNELILD